MAALWYLLSIANGCNRLQSLHNPNNQTYQTKMTTNNNNTSVRELIAARNHASYELFVVDCKIDLAITEHIKAALDLLDGIPHRAPVAQELRETLSAVLPPRLSYMLQDAYADQ